MCMETKYFILTTFYGHIITKDLYFHKNDRLNSSFPGNEIAAE